MIKPLLIVALTCSLFAKPESCRKGSIYYEESINLYSSLMTNINCYDLRIEKLKISQGNANLTSLKSPMLTPLKLAINRNNIPLVEELVNNGSEIDISDIIVAVRNQNTEILKILFKKDPRVFYESMNGMSPLRHAYYKYPYQDNDPEVISLLKEYKVKLIPAFFPENKLSHFALETFDKNLLEYQAISFNKLSKNSKIEGYRIMDGTDGLYSIFLKDNVCFAFKQGMGGGGGIPFKKLKTNACLETFQTIQKLNFWNSKLNGDHWINGSPYLLEGVRNGDYKAHISWTNNKSKIDTERVLTIIKDYIYNSKK